MHIRINTERTHIFSPDIHVAISATINISLTYAQLHKALDAVQRRHPLLSSTIVFDENNIAYYNTACSKPVSLVLADEEQQGWKEWLIHSNLAPFDFSSGPLLRVYVERILSSMTVTFLGHHLLGDGKSFYYLMRDFLMALDGNLDQTVLTPAIIQNASAFPREAQLGFLPKLLAKKLNQNYRKTGKMFTYADYTSLYHSYNIKKCPALLTCVLSTEETEKLTANCRKNGVTVNEAVSTAFFAARKKNGCRSNYLGVSCDVRNELSPSPGESMGNFVSGIAIEAKYNDTLVFWKNAKRMKMQLNKKLKKAKIKFQALSWVDALDDSLLDAINFAGNGGYQNKTAQKLCDIVCGIPADQGLGISNLGKLTCTFQHFKLEEMYFVPPLFAANDFVVGVFTVNGSMAFCLRYASADMSKQKADSILNDALKLLF